ncbi:MAG: hypothetical protein IJ590_03435 [Rickettsiales bacterium]|nr:hypothetical protein [Rickettsiales bacterium]
MSNNNNVNTNNSAVDQTHAQTAQQTPISTFRQQLNSINHNNGVIVTAKIRKKIKRWFDNCKEKDIQVADTNGLCYKYENDNEIVMGRKAVDSSQQNNTQQCTFKIGDPCLIIRKKPNNEYDIVIKDDNQETSINNINYDTFCKYHKKVMDRNFLSSLLENIYDSFMAHTSICPSRGDGQNRAYNTVLRILSPVWLPLYCLNNGGRKLDKVCRSSCEKQRHTMIINKLQNAYANTDNQTFNNEQTDKIAIYEPMIRENTVTYRQLKELLEENYQRYKQEQNQQALLHNLNNVNNQAGNQINA